jgi:hypothetical protein
MISRCAEAFSIGSSCRISFNPGCALGFRAESITSHLLCVSRFDTKSIMQLLAASRSWMESAAWSADMPFEWDYHLSGEMMNFQALPNGSPALSH